MTTASGAVDILLVLVTVRVTLTKLSRNSLNKRTHLLGLMTLEESILIGRVGQLWLPRVSAGRKQRRWATERSQSKRAPKDLAHSSPSNHWCMDASRINLELFLLDHLAHSNFGIGHIITDSWHLARTHPIRILEICFWVSATWIAPMRCFDLDLTSHSHTLEIYFYMKQY